MDKPETTATTVLATAVMLLFTVAVFFGIAMYYGFAIYLMWGWFIVPLGFPAISIPHAYGLMLFTNLLRQPADKSDGVKTAAFFLIPALTVLVGYIVQGWM